MTLADGTIHSQRFNLTSTDTNDVTLSFSLSPKVFAGANPFAWINSDYTVTLIGLDYLGRAQFTPSFTFELDWNNDGVFEDAVAGRPSRLQAISSIRGDPKVSAIACVTRAEP